jgi:peroxiredoxin
LQRFCDILTDEVVIALAAAAVLSLLVLGAGFALGLRLLRLHGQMLARCDGLEARLLGGSRAQPGAPGPSPTYAPRAVVPSAVLAPSPAAVLAAAAPLEQPNDSPATRTPLARGTLAPPFSLAEVQGGRIALSQLLGRPLLLIFFDPECGHGTRLVPDLLYCSPDGLDGRPLPVVVGEGGFEQVRSLFVDNGVRSPVFHDPDGAVAAAYGIEGTPTGYLLDAGGRIAADPLVGVDAIVAQARPNRAYGNPGALQPGTPAPAFRLPRLGGGELMLEQFRGGRLLLVFVDPSCEPCHAIAPELEALHRTNGSTSVGTTGGEGGASAQLRVLLIGRGGSEAMQAMVLAHGLSMPVALQQRWEVSRSYGSLATPLGFVLDESGVIAQPALAGLAALRAALPGLR